MARQLTTRSSLALCTGLLLAFGSPALVAEAVYKWTDSEGVTHFSALPPEGRPAEQVSVEAPPPSTPRDPEAADGAVAEDDRPKDPTEGLGELTPEEIAQQEAQRKQNCETARKNLETLKTRVHVRIRDEETGQDRYLTPEEHQQWQKDSAMRIDEYCKPPA